MPIEPPSPDFHEPFVRALTRHERVIRAYIRGAGIVRRLALKIEWDCQEKTNTQRE
jgi:hypothetical protein